jgi:nitrogen regulatory protein PII-like uncharacterized protein
MLIRVLLTDCHNNFAYFIYSGNLNIIIDNICSGLYYIYYINVGVTPDGHKAFTVNEEGESISVSYTYRIIRL